MDALTENMSFNFSSNKSYMYPKCSKLSMKFRIRTVYWWNDNHSLGPVIRELVPRSHQRSELSCWRLNSSHMHLFCLKDRPEKLCLKLTKSERCFFHLSQTHLWTCRIQELGLWILYTDSKNIAVAIRNLTALGFCLVSDVISAFRETKNISLRWQHMEMPNVGSTTHRSKMVDIIVESVSLNALYVHVYVTN